MTSWCCAPTSTGTRTWCTRLRGRFALRAVGRAQGAPAARARPLRREAAVPGGEGRRAVLRLGVEGAARRAAARGRPRRGARLPGAPLRARPAHPVRAACASSRRPASRCGSSASCARRATGPARRAHRRPAGATRDAVAGFIDQLDEAVAAAVRRRLRRAALRRPRLGGAGGARQLRTAQGQDLLRSASPTTAHSELPRAAQVAKHFGTEHHEIVLSPQRRWSTRLPRLVAHPRHAARARLPTSPCTSGAVKSRKSSQRGADRRGRRRDARRHGTRRYVAASVLQHADAAHGRRAARHSRPHCERAGGARTFRTWLKARRVTEERCPAASAPRAAQHQHLRRMLYADQSSWLPDNLLERGERIDHGGVARSARCRSSTTAWPSTSRRCPTTQRVRGLSTKWILRQAARALLPAACRGGASSAGRCRRGTWLRGELRESLLDHLQGAESHHAALLRRARRSTA